MKDRTPIPDEPSFLYWLGVIIVVLAIAVGAAQFVRPAHADEVPLRVDMQMLLCEPNATACERENAKFFYSTKAELQHWETPYTRCTYMLEMASRMSLGVFPPDEGYIMVVNCQPLEAGHDQ